MSVNIDCGEALAALLELKTRGNYQRLDKIKYPQNSLRNLARDDLNTNLFYLVDIDTVPCGNLRHDFDKFARKVFVYINSLTYSVYDRPKKFADI